MNMEQKEDGSRKELVSAPPQQQQCCVEILWEERSKGKGERSQKGLGMLLGTFDTSRLPLLFRKES